MHELETLKSLKTVLSEKFGIEKIAIFGSVARNEADQDSDIDIAIIKMEPKDYFKRVEAKYFLEKHLNREVDIGYFDSMRKVIRQEIEKDMIYV